MNPTQPEQPQAPQEFKPGETIAPAAAPTTLTPPAPVVPTQAPVSYEAPQQPVGNYAQPAPTFPAQPVGDFQPAAPNNDAIISWQASEFIDHQKTAGWYGILALAAVVVAAVVYLLTRDFISTGVVVFAAFAFGVYAARRPRQLQYTLGKRGVDIGNRHFDYSLFRSFALVDDGAFPSIIFMPLKRFGQMTTIYFDPNDEDMIMELLGDRLPFEQHKLDPIDRLMQRIHF